MIGCNLTKGERWCMVLNFLGLGMVVGLLVFYQPNESVGLGLGARESVAWGLLGLGSIADLTAWTVGSDDAVVMPQNEPKQHRVGFFIYGASLENLPVSQNERIETAFSYATNNYSGDKWEHVYFVSGKAGEAYYMKAELEKLYEDMPFWQRPTYDIKCEAAARFTVENVLLSLPMINDEDLDQLCLLTSDYHMTRSKAIYEQFEEAGLCRYPIDKCIEAYHDSERRQGNALGPNSDYADTTWYDQYHKVRAKKVGKGEAVPVLRTEDETFLNQKLKAVCKCNRVHPTKIDEIRCPRRDESNAGIFAHYIKLVKEGGDVDKVSINEGDIQEYLANNNKEADDEGFFGGFKKSVKGFGTASKSFWSS